MRTTVVTTEEFDEWWRDSGQFLSPADVSTGEDLERLRHFANSVFNDNFAKLNEKICELESRAEKAEKQRDSYKIDLDNASKAILSKDFKEKIKEALNSNSPIESVKELLK